VLSHLVAVLPPETLFVVTYTNADSIPARLMRRHWSQLFDHKSAFLSTGNLTALAARSGLLLKTQYPLPVTRTARYVGDILSRAVEQAGALHASEHDAAREAWRCRCAPETAWRCSAAGRARLPPGRSCRS
jgi:hypothetical protein